jgi:rifampicin phosphotransferase
MSDLRTFSDITKADLDLVGGKGLSLGLLAGAGLPVPPGFCVTTNACRRARNEVDPQLFEALAGAYRTLGAGLVAVRSSATAEDGAVTSFAGQQETILGVEGESALKEAVERCWSSLHTDRAKAYRQKQGVDEASLAMAVVVQRLVHAEVAGVLFTRDPNDPAGERMLIEASWGLGEAVVSGRVTPDSFHVERLDGTVRERRLGRKTVRITTHGEQEVAADQQKQFCLGNAQLAELADLGRKVESYYGEPRDVEWAYADGRFWLLQARPITTATAADRESVRRQEIDKLRKMADPRGTVWSRFNLFEVLPEPTPMTWAVVQHLLSGGGGSGWMYRDLGLNPAPLMENLTVYDLVGGRPFCNLSREPFMQTKRPQMDYPAGRYKEAPLRALDPQPDPGSIYRGLGRVLRLPVFIWKQMLFARRVSRLSLTFADVFRKSTIPAFVADVEKAVADNLAHLADIDSAVLLQRLQFWIKRSLVEFARESLKPTLFAQFSMQVLEQQLRKPLGDARAREAIAELSAGAHPDAEADLPRALLDAAEGKIDRDEFLRRFGHRGNQEMELAQPRWAEDHAALDRALNAGQKSHRPPVAASSPQERWGKIAAEAKLNSFVSKWLSTHVDRLQTYLGLRETAKHYLMRGYALIRQALVELDRRFNLNGGIFYLTPDELPQLVRGENWTRTIEERRKRRTIALSLEVPPVLFSDDLEAIGRPLPPPEGATLLQGLALSAGVAEGVALVLTEPSEAPPDLESYILVCPSTDPAWVPLFVSAKGLVMESGGTLSHGAIVAREFGLPAVAGLPGVQHQIKTGQRLRVDGGRGTVAVLS